MKFLPAPENNVYYWCSKWLHNEVMNLSDPLVASQPLRIILLYYAVLISLKIKFILTFLIS